MFYDKKCTIKSIEIVRDGNREKKQETLLYENIKCDFYQPSQRNNSFNATEQAKEYSTAKYEVVLPWKYNEVRKWMEIELFDLGSQWIFIVDDVMAYRKPNWTIDNITLQIKLRDGWSS